MRGSLSSLVAVAAGALLAAPGAAFGAGPPGASCPGDRIAPDRVIRGSFPARLRGSYVMVPFDVPAGTTAVRVKYCHDQPDGPTSALARHTLDLGLYGPAGGGALWGPGQFRGHGGSSHPDVTVSAQGFSREAEYLRRPKGHVPGRTTRGFRPGSIAPGRWDVELGLAAIIDRLLGDADGAVGWRVELELSRDRAFLRDPYRPARYDSRPARGGERWYVGDLHAHAEHSALGDATMRSTFDYAFGRAGLDFLFLTDYVTDSAWGEIGRYQRSYPRRLIGRSSEVITYRGHANSHAAGRYVDHRTGPVYERAVDGRLTLRRGARPARAIFADVHAAGGVTQVNHPTTFPSAVPLFDLLCRGCSWDYTAAETDFSRVDAIEVANGPPAVRPLERLVPNPFGVLAIDFYERALRGGHHIAAVGVSDAHEAGEARGVTGSPVGTAATAVLAPELSEQAIECGIRAGHTYARVTGARGADIRLEARAPGLDPARPAIVGDTIRARGVHLTARVLGGDGGQQLLLVRNGAPERAVRVHPGRSFVYRLPSVAPGRWRLQLQRGTTIEAVSTPIWVGAPRAGEPPSVATHPCHPTPALTPASAGRRSGARRAWEGPESRERG